MGALGVEGIRRSEYVTKRVSFHALAADPTLDGGLVASCVINDNNTSSSSNSNDDDPAGGGPGIKKAVLGSRASVATGLVAGGAQRELGTAPAMAPGTTPGSAAGATAAKRPRTCNGGRNGGSCDKNKTDGDDGGGDNRTSSLFVWPRRLEATAEAGLQVTVPYRLTCLRLTEFGARFKGARNALLAGTRDGVALAFDWGCLVIRSNGGGAAGGSEEEENGAVHGGGKRCRPQGNETVKPFAQVN